MNPVDPTIENEVPLSNVNHEVPQISEVNNKVPQDQPNMTSVVADASPSIDASPSAIGMRKLTSDVWSHFRRKKINGMDKAICNYSTSSQETKAYYSSVEYDENTIDVDGLEMVEECLSQDMDLSGLLLLYSSPGDAEGIIKLASLAKEQGNNNITFLCLLMLSKMEDCLQLLVDSVELGFVKSDFTITKCTSADRKVKMGRGVTCGGGQSSLGYLFGSGEAPKSAGESVEPIQKPAFKSTGEPTEPLQKPTPVTQVDNKQIPTGIQGNQANNYQRADGQNCGNFITASIPHLDPYSYQKKLTFCLEYIFGEFLGYKFIIDEILHGKALWITGYMFFSIL
ncbi:hypothetical protein ZIOFF_010546 [Zingiber officinale]|uniref:COPA/B TPR domain-containing protein n=1 Tax=Zingiber officinale TaxID=94328 RepID=A0A8J5HP82_ZINOF|nr:hypothetical protein ZIOFF_010546 [Zingiber officinale]